MVMGLTIACLTMSSVLLWRMTMPADGDAVVDGRLAFMIGVPLVHVGRAHLQLKGRGDAVQRLQTVVLRRLAVRVQVHEARRHHQPGGVQHRGRRDGIADRWRGWVRGKVPPTTIPVLMERWNYPGRRDGINNPRCLT